MKAAALVVVTLAAATLTAVAEQYPQFVSMMKMTNAASDALRKMDKKTGPQAMRIAERLGGAYEEMIPFWRQRRAADAVKISEQGKAAAAELASAAFANDAERAEAAFKTLSGTCKACHDARREKLPSGAYHVK